MRRSSNSTIPNLKGRPVIVGADPKEGRGRGVVAACSYEARKFGVRSALPISQAWKLCPQGAFVPVRMDRYVEVSKQVMEVLHRFTNLVEPLSIDEAFLDVSGSTALFGAPEQIARAIKKQIREATGLCASVGVAPNKFVAKIASDLKKPDGLVIVKEDRGGGIPAGPAHFEIVGSRTERQKSACTKWESEPLAIFAQIPSRADRLLGAAVSICTSSRMDETVGPLSPTGKPDRSATKRRLKRTPRIASLLLRTIRSAIGIGGTASPVDDHRARRITLKFRYEGFETHTRQMTLERSNSKR